MADENVAPTITCKPLKDPACTEPRIVEPRKLHEENAYGGATSVCRRIPSSDKDKTRLETFEDVAIDRLFVLNATRARGDEFEAG